MNNYHITLGNTYYNKGFFNIGIIASGHLGNHGEALRLILKDQGELSLTINRNANKNKSVRIYGGNPLREFIQNNFNLYDIMKFEVVNQNTIRII